MFNHDEVYCERILIIDDNTSIHEDFQTILEPVVEPSQTRQELENGLFGEPEAESAGGGRPDTYKLDFATQGQAGLEILQQAMADGEPIGLAFVDMRMPPGWDGLETIINLWQADPNLQVVICTAYSDYSHHQITDALGVRDNLLILKKPFDADEVRQMAKAMLHKWALDRLMDRTMNKMESIVSERTEALAQAKMSDMDNRKTLRSLQEQVKSEQAKLVQSEKLASIGQVAAGIAHEINNPVGFVNSNLGTLRGYFDTLTQALDLQTDLIRCVETDTEWQPARDRLEDLTHREDLPFIREDIGTLISESLQGAQRVRDIVKCMNDYARAKDPEPHSVDLVQGIRDTVKMMSGQFKETCRLDLRLDPLPKYTCHPVQVYQVISNLLTNAAQAMENDGTITVVARECAEGILFQVRDTGPGMDPDTRERVFDPFFSTKPSDQGTGLGLSISQNIIHRHGGTLTVASEPGRGTTFTVNLPVPEIQSGSRPEPFIDPIERLVSS